MEVLTVYVNLQNPANIGDVLTLAYTQQLMKPANRDKCNSKLGYRCNRQILTDMTDILGASTICCNGYYLATVINWQTLLSIAVTNWLEIGHVW